MVAKEVPSTTQVSSKPSPSIKFKLVQVPVQVNPSIQVKSYRHHGQGFRKYLLQEHPPVRL